MIKEGQTITYEEAKKAGWRIESIGELNKSNYWRITLISPSKELTATFYWGLTEATVERAE